jgi:hypothetical protein
MASLAGDGLGVGIDPIVIMRCLNMAIGTGNLFFWINRVIVGNYPAFYNVVLRLVAICAQEIFPSHVDIQAVGREVQAFVQIAVLYPISTSSVKMTFSTVIPSRGAYTFGCSQ